MNFDGCLLEIGVMFDLAHGDWVVVLIVLVVMMGWVFVLVKLMMLQMVHWLVINFVIVFDEFSIELVMLCVGKLVNLKV